MRSAAQFLRPTRTKLVFWVEWGLYLAFVAAIGQAPRPDELLVLVYPLALYYLTACIFAALVNRGATPPFHRLLGWAALLAGGDQAAELAVLAWLPLGARVTLLPGRIYLEQALNPYTSWLVSLFGRAFLPPAGMSLLSLILAAGLVEFYRFYSASVRRSGWMDLALVFLLAGLGSAFCDQAFRAVTVDFLALKGLFVADLKDIFLSFGVGSLLAEAVSGPRDFWKLAGSTGSTREFFRFILEDIQALFPGRNPVK